MKTIALTIAFLFTFIQSQILFAQTRKPAALGREEYIEVEKNVKLHVIDLGEGQPVVLIHGWPLNNEMYEYQYQYLVEKGFRVIGISLRGFGKSDRPYGKYDFDTFSDDIKVVLEKLKIENATLGGFSMGSAVVLHYITKYNGAHIKKLAVFGATGPSWKQREGHPYGITEQGAKDLIKQTKANREQLVAGFGKAFEGQEGGLSPESIKWLENINLNASPFATTQAISALGDLDLRPVLGKIKMPVAIFHGVNDKLCDYAQAEQLNKAIKGSYIVKFEKGGHGLFLEEMDKFNSELEKFARN
ncbi:alpha/beta fold hydrolase [Dyadobacter sp. CY347]|uniref:alpha/beta fold hydrolase n=1 Tax=Dyadobacter sp. CY347 TaxID=2909336 RepID=UPI001F390FA5|nr:alpha/beta hydrolase [Dyadobacter sp. CY347]MCF2489961.1 alpha/beta hydrolase [Dyadobacter sp. CY347]